MDEDELIDKAQAFAEKHSRILGSRLGFGIHGTVFVLKSETYPARSALKFLADARPYRRERENYERLQEAKVVKLCGFNVPQLLGWDDDLFAIEMTVVKPPYILDFAGAFLDFPPDFSDEAWDDWNLKNQEQFGADWPEAQSILAELESHGIYMLDPSPSNIRFR